MEKADKKRSSYYNYYSYKTWGAAATYHLCIDSSVLGIDGTVEFIKNFVKAETSSIRKDKDIKNREAVQLRLSSLSIFIRNKPFGI